MSEDRVGVVALAGGHARCSHTQRTFELFHSRVMEITIVLRLLLAASCLLYPSSASAQHVTNVADAAEKQQWKLVGELLERSNDPNAVQPDGMTALHWAAFYDRSSIARQLIDTGADVNARTEYSITPFSISCQNNALSVVSVLLDSAVDPNQRLDSGETSLMIASRVGNPEMIRELVTHKADPNATDRRGQTALMWAAAEGNFEAVDVLLEVGAKADMKSDFGFTAMFFAARHGHTNVCLQLVESGVDVNAVIDPKRTSGRSPRARMSALMFAVESAHYETALALVQAGADPNDQRSGFAPLHALSWVRKPSIGDNPAGDPPPRGSGEVTPLRFVRELVALGADVNLQLRRGTGGPAKINPKGATPFLMAAETADLPLMRTLIHVGADAMQTNADNTNALIAVSGVGVMGVGEEPGSEEEVLLAVDYLVDLGVDINAVDKKSETVMHGAAYHNYPRVVKRLSDHGADQNIWNIKNKFGWTPIMIASGHRPGSFKPSPETIAALKQALTSNEDSGVE